MNNDTSNNWEWEETDDGYYSPYVHEPEKPEFLTEEDMEI